MEPTGKTSEEGRIPELTEDGQNWKICHAKFLEVTATKHLLSIVAGWESDDGSKDWAHQAEVARMLFLMTTPPLLKLLIQLFESAQQIFQYFTSYFLDFDPIEDPHTKKLVTSTNKTFERSQCSHRVHKELTEHIEAWLECSQMGIMQEVSHGVKRKSYK